MPGELIEVTKISTIELMENVCFGSMFTEECDASKNYLL